MRILIFSTAYLPHIGGAEIAIKEITDRLPEFEFDLVTARFKREWPAAERVGNVTVYRVGMGGQADKFLLPVLGVDKALSLHKKRKYDLVWSMMASQAGIAAGLFKMAKKREAKLLLTLQEGDEEEHLRRYVGGNELLYKILIRPWHLLPFRKADRIQVISGHLEKRAQNNEVRCPIAVIPNGVDFDKFDKISDKSVQAAAGQLGRNTDDIWLITVSRLEKKNAVSDIIAALPLLDGNVRLAVIGEGNERKTLEKLAGEKGVANRVRFMGSVPNDQLPPYLRAADIFIRPSLSEGQGIAYLEAMAAGIPVIATPVGGIVDFLSDPEHDPDKAPTGLFCQIKDPASIAKTVKQYLDDRDLRQRIVENARNLVKDKYGWDGIAEKMEALFTQIVKNGA